MPDTFTIEELGRKAKQKWPQYGSFPDAEVGQKALRKWPQYQGRIVSAPTSAIQSSRPEPRVIPPQPEKRRPYVESVPPPDPSRALHRGAGAGLSKETVRSVPPRIESALEHPPYPETFVGPQHPGYDTAQPPPPRPPIISGVARFGEGAIQAAKDISRLDIQPEPYTEMLWGGTEAALAAAAPGIGGAFLKNKLLTTAEMVAGGIGGYSAGQGLRAGAEAAGIGPGGQELLGSVGEIAVPGTMVSRALGRYGRPAVQTLGLKPPPSPTPRQPRLETPPEIPRPGPLSEPSRVAPSPRTVPELEVPPPDLPSARVEPGPEPYRLGSQAPATSAVLGEPPRPLRSPQDALPRGTHNRIWALATSLTKTRPESESLVRSTIQNLTGGKTSIKTIDRGEGQRIIAELEGAVARQERRPKIEPPPSETPPIKAYERPSYERAPGGPEGPTIPPEGPRGPLEPPPPAPEKLQLGKISTMALEGLPMGRALRRLGRPGEKLSERLYQALDVAEVKASRRIDDLRKGGLTDDLSREEQFEITDILEGRAQPSSQRTAGAAKSARRLYDEVIQEAGVARDGKPIQIRNNAGDTYDISPRKDYTVHHIPRTEILADKSNPIRKDILDGVVHRGEAPDLDTATQILDDLVAYQQRRTNQPSKVLDFLVNSQGMTRERALSLLAKYRATKPRSNESLSFARELDLPFWDPMISRTIPAYARNVSRFIEQTRYLGQKGEEVSRLIGQVREANVEGRSPDEIADWMKDVTSRILGTDVKRTGAEKVSSVLRMIQATRIGFRTAIANSAQATLFGILRTNAPTALKGLGKALTSDAWRQAERGGAQWESVLRKAMADEGINISTPGLRKLAKVVEWSLKWRGFTASERGQRVIGFGIGKSWMDGLVKRGQRKGFDSVRTEMKSLLGFDTDTVIARLQKGGKLTEDEMLLAGKRMSDQLNFRSRAIDVPYATHGPWGKLIWQFKQFSYNAALLQHDQIIAKLRKGSDRDVKEALRNIATLGITMPLVGEIVDDLRSMVPKGPRGVADKWEKNSALKNYILDAFQVGAYAMLADSLQAGTYGKLASWVGGPTVGTAAEFGEGAAVLMTNQNVAPLTRAMLRATPILNETVYPWMREDIDEMLKGATSELRKTVGTAKRPKPYKVK